MSSGLPEGGSGLPDVSSSHQDVGSRHPEAGLGHLEAGSGYLEAGSGHFKDGWMDGWADVWADGRNFSPLFYRTSSPIGSAAQKVMRQGKGTADHLLPLGCWLMVIYLNVTGLQSNSQNADCRGPNGTETTGSYCIHFYSVLLLGPSHFRHVSWDAWSRLDQLKIIFSLLLSESGDGFSGSSAL